MSGSPAIVPPERPQSTVVGRLEDGTPYFAPLGEMPYDPDEDRVQCHLCGGWYRVVGGTHIIVKHGWTADEYRAAFGLLKQDPTCARGTSGRLRTLAVASMAAGKLTPGSSYRKPGGAPGRGVRRSASLGALRRDLVDELHPDLNGDLDPYRLGVKSGKKLWWRCKRCAYEWQAAPHDRSRGDGCPRCGQQHRTQTNRHVSRERSLAINRPDLLAELHPTKNADLDVYTLGAGSGQKVWWRCSQCGNDWRMDPASRARGCGCPACGRRRTAAAISYQNSHVPAERSLAVKRPELAAELHPTRNPDLDPNTLAAYSNRTAWWLCPACGHEWQAAPHSRRQASGCPKCRRPAKRTG